MMTKKIVLEGGTLIDGTGSKPLENSVIVIEGQKIVGVGEAEEIGIPSDSKFLDIRGKTVMPGLIDAHMHFGGVRSLDRGVNLYVSDGLKIIRAVNDARALLNAGFTTVKDCGSRIGSPLRDAIYEGTITGPRILAAVYNISPTFGHGDRQHLRPKWAKESNPGICDGVSECRRAVRLAFRSGADYIKVSATGGEGAGPRDNEYLPGHTVEELKAIVDEAEKFKSFVTTHSVGGKGVKNAIVAGVKTIDHGVFIEKEDCRMMAERGTILVPTLPIVYQNSKPKAREYGLAQWLIDRAKDKKAAYENEKRNTVRMAKDAGVTVAAGTDFNGGPLKEMGTNAMELQLYVEKCGFKPMEAIVSATLNGAKACGLENEIGTVEVNKKADIIVVNGDPLKDISIFQDIKNIEAVLRNGMIYKMTLKVK